MEGLLTDGNKEELVRRQGQVMSMERCNDVSLAEYYVDANDLPTNRRQYGGVVIYGTNCTAVLIS